MNVDQLIDEIHEQVSGRFQSADRVRSFAEFLEDFMRAPGLYLRTSPQYLLDMMESFGTRDAQRVGQEAVRYRVFDATTGSDIELVGQERVQQEIYRNLLAAAKRGKAGKMLLLRGPNGSGKTTVVECLIRGLEEYSKSEAGALVKFAWVFTERENRLGRIGFEAQTGLDDDLEGAQSYAHLDEKDVSSKIPCELCDSPIFLIPTAIRADLIRSAVDGCAPEFKPKYNYDHYLENELCQKCRRIYDALLMAYQGDWRKVVRHVQVERFFISKRYRQGAASIEPQGNVDANVRSIQGDNAWSIPGLLKNISLYEPLGDIVDANRGILEYSDFLKRPMEANKYLLTTCERGTVSLPNCIAYLDLVIVGTSNEKQLNLFKRSPDFSSFKARIELVAVPYLLRYSAEQRLYERQIQLCARERHVTPHTAEVAAMWAVLTRLCRPNSERYDGPLGQIVASLTPFEKARLYDSGEAPTRLSESERQILRGGVINVRQEYEDVEGEFEGIVGPEYEGRRGASPREMITILSRAAESPKFKCLTPMAVFEALEELLKDSSLYDFLRLPPDGGYHDVHKFLQDVREEYLGSVTKEVYESIELIDVKEYTRVFLEYFRHVKAFHTGEKVFNSTTDSYDSPNEELMGSIEKLLDLKESKDKFRSQVITRIAAWSLDHPKDAIDYQALFPEIHSALRDNFYKERNRLLTLIEEDILKFGTDEFELLSDQDKRQVEHALCNMNENYGYCEACARDVIAFVLRYRPESATSEESASGTETETVDPTTIGTKS